MKKSKGIRIVSIFIPTIVLIGALYIAIIIWTVLFNSSTTNIIYEMNRTANSINYISVLQARSSKLSETATTFIVTPQIGNPTDPSTNIEPLKAYVNELIIEERDPDYIFSKLEEYDLTEETDNLILESVDYIKDMNEAQFHAIYLIASYVDIDEEVLNKIPVYELTTEELAMTNDEKHETAHFLLEEGSYNVKKGAISTNLSTATQNVNDAANKRQIELTNEMKMLRGALWGSILLIVLLNTAFFIILLAMLVLPILKFTKGIDKNERLEETLSLYETKHLAAAYNGLLDRHEEFDSQLRDVAEMDSLTGLPNRYSYNELLKKPIDENESACAFLFDINNLKQVNDNYGHDKGDELILNAAKCIKDVFLLEDKKNCYRIGGDEFVSIITNINEESIEALIEEFYKLQEKYNVSIAVGYSYSSDVNKIGYEKLVSEADTKMYINKNEMKKNSTN